jgi:Flp pilus assembly protein protease CpaA
LPSISVVFDSCACGERGAAVGGGVYYWAGNCLWIFLLTAVLGGFIALVLVNFAVIQDLSHLRTLFSKQRWAGCNNNPTTALPRGAMIAVGSAVSLVKPDTKVVTRLPLLTKRPEPD